MLEINCEWQKLELSRGRSWFNLLENKNIYQEIASSVSLGSKFYILPEKLETVALTEVEVDNFLEIWCHDFILLFCWISWLSPDD